MIVWVKRASLLAFKLYFFSVFSCTYIRIFKGYNDSMCKYMSVKTDTIYRVDLPHIVGWIFLTQYLKTYSLLFTTSNILTKWEKVLSDQTISSIWDLAGNARDFVKKNSEKEKSSNSVEFIHNKKNFYFVLLFGKERRLSRGDFWVRYFYFEFRDDRSENVFSL